MATSVPKQDPRSKVKRSKVKKGAIYKDKTQRFVCDLS